MKSFVTKTKDIVLASFGVIIMGLGVKGAVTSVGGYFWSAVFVVWIGFRIVVKA